MFLDSRTVFEHFADIHVVDSLGQFADFGVAEVNEYSVAVYSVFAENVFKFEVVDDILNLIGIFEFRKRMIAERRKYSGNFGFAVLPYRRTFVISVSEYIAELKFFNLVHYLVNAFAAHKSIDFDFGKRARKFGNFFARALISVTVNYFDNGNSAVFKHFVIGVFACSFKLFYVTHHIAERELFDIYENVLAVDEVVKRH